MKFICFVGTLIFGGLFPQSIFGVSPNLNDVRAFEVFAKTGNQKTFDNRELVESKTVKEFRNGELLFIIIGPQKALLSANTGLSTVQVSKTNESVKFIETMPAGNQHVMAISNRWDTKQKGFRFTYTRHSKDSLHVFWRDLPKKTHRYLYSGIAKPVKQPIDSNQYNSLLHQTDVFTMYGHKARFKEYNLKDGGKLVGESTAKSVNDKALKGFTKGEMQYTITTPKSAIFSGNAGSSVVDLIRDDTSLTFIERSIGDNTFVMIIYDTWDSTRKGFEYVYIRHWEVGEIILLRSIYFGVAKPTR